MAAAKVLIVEDEKIVAEDIRDRLISLGYAVPAITSRGEDAEMLTEKFRPDIILMDIRLKGAMDGIDAAQHIRARFDIPILYLTAYADDHTLQRAVLTQPFGYILKPVENRELHTGIEMAIYKHRLERELKEREQWLATTLRSIGDAVIATDAQGRIKFMNPIAEKLTGWTQSEALGKALTDVFSGVRFKHKEPLGDFPALLTQDGTIVGLPRHTILTAKDGRGFPIDENISPISDQYGNVIGTVIVFKDVTLRQRAEEALKSVSRSILDAQEAERRRVSRELHDGVIQILSTVKYRFNIVEDKFPLVENDVKKDSEKIKELLERSIDEVRRISRNLRPSELDDLGLIPAIRILCDEFKERTSTDIDLRYSRVPKGLPSDVNLTIYRIIQEALNNVEKHAQATSISVKFMKDGSALHLSICDNGKGFEPKALKFKRGKNTGFGLVDMVERAEFIGGTFNLRSSPHNGTDISVHVPLHTAKEK